MYFIIICHYNTGPYSSMGIIMSCDPARVATLSADCGLAYLYGFDVAWLDACLNLFDKVKVSSHTFCMCV